MKKPWFACREVFSLLLVPIISRAAGQHPASPGVLKGLGQAGEGFSLNWEELGGRKERQMQIPAPVQGAQEAGV